MEAAPAIAWLAQTILATLLIDKLDAWIRQVGLAVDVEKLKSEIKKVKIVVSAVKGKGIEKELLDESFSLFEDLLYDSDDVVDELDYYRLQQQVQGGSTPTARLLVPADPCVLVPSNFCIQGVTRDEPEGMHGAERADEISRGNVDTPSNGVGKLRSVVWEHFTITEKDNGKPVKAVCRRCGNDFKCDTKTNGTSSMKKHLENEHSVTCTKKPPGAHPPNPSSTSEHIVIGSSSRRKGKRRRSMAWEHFDVTEEKNEQPIKARCKYCPTEIKCGPKSGTAGMLNHNKICKDKPGPNEHPLNLSSNSDAHSDGTPILIGDSSNRKRRVYESVQITAANIVTPWDMAELSNRIQKIASRLQHIRGKVSEILKLHGSDTISSSHCQRITTSYQHLRTSSLVPRKVYGRVAEKNSIMKFIMTEDRSDNVTVAPIVGIAGVGKTTLAQLVYNDPRVERQFHHRIWVWVSRNFDEMRLTKEMLSFVSQERHEGIDCFVKLQEILKSHVKSKRVLLVLDDVWDDKNDCRWDQLLAPFKPDSANGNVILVTTRKLSVAKMIGTTGPIKLGALENDDFWLLFKSCAFGDGNYECLGNLSTIGQQIVEKLKGNPLAAVTAGTLLRDHHTVDHWSNILKKENWKSLRLIAGIMPALKISYDELPYHLQLCLSYCSIYPYNYQFLGKDLVYIWISQGFVSCTNLSKRMEVIGWEYLDDLTNMGFFQKVEIEEASSVNQLNCETCYVICDLMYDLLRVVSRTECATIDDLESNEIVSTVRHLSIVTDVVYNKDQYGHIPRNEKFEQKLQTTVTCVRNLRTLILIGQYDRIFFQLFRHIFQNAHNLRLLQMSTTSAEINSFLCCLVNTAHIRYLKFQTDEKDGALHGVFSRFSHIQVLDVGSYTGIIVPNGINSLASLRHLVAEKEVCSSIASIGNMTSLQELHDFQVQISGDFEITQLKSMNELVQLGVSQLDNVKTQEEAYGAGLRNKECLEKLHLSWNDSSDASSESSDQDTAREVLEGLEPHVDLKHLHISRYNGTTSPTWLSNNISVTSLQTLHLDDCGGWRILPSLESLPFLTKLKLSSMQEVIEILVPSLEELVLIKMPNLARCLSTSVEGLSSSLRVLQMEKCRALKVFDLLENNDEFEFEQKPWLHGLRKLILCDCPQLEVLKPLPPTTFSELLITRVSTLPSMKGSSSEMLRIGYIHTESSDIDESSDQLRILDDKILVFRNLRNLKLMRIVGCQNLSSFSFQSFSHLVSLKSLEIYKCKKLFSSDVMPEHTLEDVIAANCRAFPSLESLRILSCGIAGKWLSLMLQHVPDLEELSLDDCAHITTVLLPLEEEENSLLNLISAREDSSSGNQDDALTWLARDGLLHIPSNIVSSLKEMNIGQCPRLKFNWGKDCFSGFTSLVKLTISDCRDLFSSLVHKDGNDDQANGRWFFPKSLQDLDISYYSQETLQPCFPRYITSLKKLEVYGSPDLQSLQLHSCTALEALDIASCKSLTRLEGLQSLGSLRDLSVFDCEFLTALEGLQSLGRLRSLSVHNCPSLPPCLKSFSRQGYKLCPRLEVLYIDDPSFLTMSFCKHLTSLQRIFLQVYSEEMTRLTDEQERALVLLKSLQELEFLDCSALVDLPAGLHTLPSLKRLKIKWCPDISRLPEAGLPLSLEQLEIVGCSKELTDQCRLLATSKLNVKITQRPPID